MTLARPADGTPLVPQALGAEGAQAAVLAVAGREAVDVVVRVTTRVEKTLKIGDRVAWDWDDDANDVGTGEVVAVYENGTANIRCDEGGNITVETDDDTVRRIAS